MVKYQFQISNDGSTVEAVLKVLAMIQNKDYSVSVDSDKHVLTIVVGEKNTQQKVIKRELRKSCWKLFWKSSWKHIRHWVAHRGYWIPMLIAVPILVVFCEGDTISKTLIGIWIDVMILILSMP